MTVYWLLFSYFAIGSMLAYSSRNLSDARPGPLFSLGAIITCAVVGLRYMVGGDWIQYTWFFYVHGQMNFFDALFISDPGYEAISWIVYQTGAAVWLLNLICGAIFTWGLFQFCRTQPHPWLSALLAVPYMIIVIAMGYTRQGVALGLLMAGIATVTRGASTLKFGIYVLLAALFHKTAVVAFPVVALANNRNRLIGLSIVAVGFIGLYYAFLGDSIDRMWSNYFGAGYSSQGAMVRTMMNMLAAAVFVFFRNRLGFSDLEKKIWANFSFATAVTFLGLLAIPSSAAIDRISLYLLPLQLAVLSRIPLIIRSRNAANALVVVYCFSIQFVWLNYAQNSWAWLPYRFYPISTSVPVIRAK